MGFVEYPHFFRFVCQAASTDRRQLPLVVNSYLDENCIKELILAVKSKSRYINRYTRLLFLPHMMRDTHMPRMINIKPYVFPTYEQLLLTELPSIQHCVTPAYERLSSFSIVPLRIPATLANNSSPFTASLCNS